MHGAAAPVELHHAVGHHALGQVLVRGADDHLVHGRVVPGHGGGRGEGVVRLEVDHRPHRHAERRHRVLEQLKLGAQFGGHAGAGLVPGPEVVAEGLDDVVGCHPDVGGAVGEHPEQREHDAARRADLGAVVGGARRLAEEVPEELVRPVDEMDADRRQSGARPRRLGPDVTARAIETAVYDGGRRAVGMPTEEGCQHMTTQPMQGQPWPEGTPGGHVVSFPVTTSFDFPQWHVDRSVGMAFGVVVRSMGAGRGFTSIFRIFAGGEVKQYTKLLEDTRRHAVDRMIENARLMGANGIIGMRFDASEIAQQLTEVVAYGTAVVIGPRTVA